MSDVAKYLPLSQRGPEDESSVTGNWSTHLVATLGELAAILDRASPSQLELPTTRAGFDVRTTVGHTLWHLGRSRTQRARDVTGVMIRGRMTRAAALRELSRTISPDSPTVCASALRERAHGVGTSGQRSTVGDLSVAVVDGYSIAATLGTTLKVDPIASGAVALARSLSAPVEVRAVLQDRSLKATDATWIVGRGRELAGTASELVLFLWGLAGLPEHGTKHDRTATDAGGDAGGDGDTTA
jgi:hypothetical protein